MRNPAEVLAPDAPSKKVLMAPLLGAVKTLLLVALLLVAVACLGTTRVATVGATHAAPEVIPNFFSALRRPSEFPFISFVMTLGGG